MVSVGVIEVWAEVESVRVMVTVPFPEVVGVPEMVAVGPVVGWRVKPAGNPLLDQV